MNAGTRWIALTQRQVSFPRRGEQGDYLDRRWYRLLRGYRLLAVPNDLAAARAAITGLDLALIVLTGGNTLPGLPGATDTAPARDQAEDWLLGHAASNGIPVAGVCHGAQLLAVRHGAQLTRACHGHAGTRHGIRAATGPPPWGWPRVFTVDSHHQYAISPAGFPADLTPLGVAPDGTIEAFAHRALPWRGLMWHPEREDPPGPGTQALHSMLPGHDREEPSPCRP